MKRAIAMFGTSVAILAQPTRQVIKEILLRIALASPPIFRCWSLAVFLAVVAFFSAEVAMASEDAQLVGKPMMGSMTDPTRRSPSEIGSGKESSRGLQEEWKIDWQLLFQAALHAGVDREPDVKAKIAAAREQIIVSGYLDGLIKKKVRIPETVLRAYYTKNREEFKLSEPIKASHILVRSAQEAQEILGKLKSGAEFSQLARERSLDPSRRHGGQMGWLERRVMDPDFGKAAFALGKGEISGVVQTKFGYHVIRVDDKKLPAYAEYDTAKEAIRRKLTRQKARAVVKQLREELRAQAALSSKERVSKEIEVKGGVATSSPP